MVTAISDSREQNPLCLDPLKVKTEALTTGDYTCVGCEDLIRIERKSLPDLIGCVGRDRDRFEREVERLLAFPVRILLIESTWPAIEMKGWRGKVAVSQVVGSLLGWQAKGISVHMAGDHKRAGEHAARLLYTVARRRFNKLKVIVANAI